VPLTIPESPSADLSAAGGGSGDAEQVAAGGGPGGRHRRRRRKVHAGRPAVGPRMIKPVGIVGEGCGVGRLSVFAFPDYCCHPRLGK
jgi:hypothetical protein